MKEEENEGIEENTSAALREEIRRLQKVAVISSNARNLMISGQ